MNSTQKSKLMDPRMKEERDQPKNYTEVIEAFDPETQIAKAFFVNKQGGVTSERHIVNLNVYHGANTPGDVCGLTPQIAERLVRDRNASYWQPPPEARVKSEERWTLLKKEQFKRASVVTK